MSHLNEMASSVNDLLLVDLYQLTMVQGYFRLGKHNTTVGFDYFFRSNPFEGGYVIFAGLDTLLTKLKRYKLSKDGYNYLKYIGFSEDFLNLLLHFELKITLWSVPEGEVVFPLEPVVYIQGPLWQVQLIETILLNIINFQSLIATKAARLVYAAKGKDVTEIGLRRAQSGAGVEASRAAFIGGIKKTSNVLAGYLFNLPLVGTISHSWVQSFGNDIDSFRAYAKLYPQNSVFLLDTYNTMKSGLPAAIEVAKEMEKEGNQLRAVRIDSGDLAYYSKHIRQELDDQQLYEVKIIASNLLDEYVIHSLIEQGTPIDVFGVGTSLVCGKPDGALDGVYKMSVIANTPTMKISNSFHKQTLPGRKSTLRYLSSEGMATGDGIILYNEIACNNYIHPYNMYKKMDLSKYHCEPLLKLVLNRGKNEKYDYDLIKISAYCHKRKQLFTAEYHRFEYPHCYRVGLSLRLCELRKELLGSTYLL